MALSANAKKSNFVVVIDAGHGGKDIGAYANEKQEKELTLKIAKEVENYLKKSSGFKVILTRKDDKLVSLADRVKIAEKEKAQLFVSIHMNSLDQNNPNRETIRGNELYIFGMPEGGDVAEHPGGNETVARLSRGFANILDKQLKDYTKIAGLGIKEGNFQVLRDNSVPSVLVEVDFLCNPEAAKYVSSSKGQKNVANAIVKAIKLYRDEIKKKGDRAFMVEEKAPTGDCFVLPPSNSVKRSAKENPAVVGKRSSERRRQSASARRASANRNVETDDIPMKAPTRTTSATSSSQAQSLYASPTEDPAATGSKQRKETSVKKTSGNKKADEKKNVKQQTKNAEKKQASKPETKTEKKAEPASKPKQEKSSKNKPKTRTVGGKQVIVSEGTGKQLEPTDAKASEKKTNSKTKDTKTQDTKTKEVKTDEQNATVNLQEYEETKRKSANDTHKSLKSKTKKSN